MSSDEAQQPAKNPTLHGSAPDRCTVALLLVDVINDLGFEGGDRLVEQAIPMASAIHRLKRRARAAGIPVVYLNDNYGRWHSDFAATVRNAVRDDSLGRPIAELLRPDPEDYFVLKPKHSGFFATSLDTLLTYLGARTVIVTGIATDSCVLFTAADAHMRDLFVVVPEDCVAAESRAAAERALTLMRKSLAADTTPSDELDLDALLALGSEGG